MSAHGAIEAVSRNLGHDRPRGTAERRLLQPLRMQLQQRSVAVLRPMHAAHSGGGCTAVAVTSPSPSLSVCFRCMRALASCSRARAGGARGRGCSALPSRPAMGCAGTHSRGLANRLNTAAIRPPHASGGCDRPTTSGGAIAAGRARCLVAPITRCRDECRCVHSRVVAGGSANGPPAPLPWVPSGKTRKRRSPTSRGAQHSGRTQHAPSLDRTLLPASESHRVAPCLLHHRTDHAAAWCSADRCAVCSSSSPLSLTSMSNGSRSDSTATHGVRPFDAPALPFVSLELLCPAVSV